jgi:hypothetical protein
VNANTNERGNKNFVLCFCVIRVERHGDRQTEWGAGRKVIRQACIHADMLMGLQADRHSNASECTLKKGWSRICAALPVPYWLLQEDHVCFLRPTIRVTDQVIHGTRSFLSPPVHANDWYEGFRG